MTNAAAIFSALPALVLMAAGCSEPSSGLGMSVGARPLTVVDYSELGGELIPDGVGTEVWLMRYEENLSWGTGFAHLPMCERGDDQRVDVYFVDAMMHSRWGSGDSGCYLLIGAGSGALVISSPEAPDIYGLGVSLLVGGTFGTERLHLNLFGDVRCWAAADREGIKAARAAGLGAVLSVSF